MMRDHKITAIVMNNEYHAATVLNSRFPSQHSPNQQNRDLNK